VTDEEYIRKAVELADGFEAMDECIDILEGDGTLWASAEWEGTEQCVLDALAAQIVRQVRSVALYKGQPWVWTNMRHAVIGKSLKDDVTMLTIKAIVDSGVLECDSEPSS